ncbi:hypothetical protein EF913_19115 [Streptomyces sp. WAC04189]|uniref:Ig-like domain-containing protein n=1 Tax=Streptomyces TaxID=1883 RepID=UPI000FA286BE|nr:Ig-like domain-containing protein [Streptomyces sp. WAC04189]RSS00864.1 hypothetical protein EF913_19115 [Streptomyces sp. WAC04189]
MSGTWYPIARAWVTHPRAPHIGGTLELFADTDPARPVAPGQEFGLTLAVTPTGGAYRTYGYLLDDFLGGAATMVRHQGLSHLDNGRYATYATDAEPRTVTCLVRVQDSAPEGAVLLPRVIVGLMHAPGDKLIPSTAVSDAGFRVRRHWLPGQNITLRPGGRAVLPAGHTVAPGLRFMGVGLARHGVLTCMPDGSVTYQADPAHLGYDRFELAFEDGRGHRVWSEVTVHVGDFGASPGALATYG